MLSIPRVCPPLNPISGPSLSALRDMRELAAPTLVITGLFVMLTTKQNMKFSAAGSEIDMKEFVVGSGIVIGFGCLVGYGAAKTYNYCLNFFR
jgi:hypothetical protein